MSQETKRAATVGAATAQSNDTQARQASCRVNFTTGRDVLRGQLCFLFDDALPSPESIVRHGNQRADIVAWLLDGNSLTSDEGRYLFKAARVAARISELRKSGWNIATKMITPYEGTAKVARYRLNLECPFTPPSPSEGGALHE